MHRQSCNSHATRNSVAHIYQCRLAAHAVLPDGDRNLRRRNRIGTVKPHYGGRCVSAVWDCRNHRAKSQHLDSRQPGHGGDHRHFDGLYRGCNLRLHLNHAPGRAFADLFLNPEPLHVVNGEIASTTLTITTTNTNLNQTTNASVTKKPSRIFYGLLIPLPFVVIAGFGAAGKRSRKLLGFLGLFLIAAGLITLPACGSTTVNNGNITPGNTYTFTIGAYDANGVSPSSTVTVTLTVN